MSPMSLSEKLILPVVVRRAPTERRPLIEDRDWYASSRDLAEGCVVQELVETIPVELATLM